MIKKVLLILLLLGNTCFAQDVVEGDFSISPGKTEHIIEKGGTSYSTLDVFNNFGHDQKFIIEIEDVKGNEEGSITFSNGASSLIVRPKYTEFILSDGHGISIPLEISVPFGADPGGHYAMVAVKPVSGSQASGAEVITRLAAIEYVTVPGNFTENGFLSDFNILNEKDNLVFKIFFKNEGDIHIAPEGKIEIFNIFNYKVAEIKVEKFFALPGSLKMNKVEWPKQGFLFGYNKAKITLQGTMVEEQTKGFFVVDWVSLILIVLIIVVLFTIRKKLKHDV